MGLELLAQPESPAEFRRSLDKTKVDFSRMAGNRTEKPIANCVKAITLLSRSRGGLRVDPRPGSHRDHMRGVPMRTYDGCGGADQD